MVNNIHSFECAVDEIGIANVTLQELSLRIDVLWTSTAMDLFHQSIQNSDTMAVFDERIDEMRADEAGPSSNQYVHSLAP
jgi:hypothetical protein